MDKVEYFTQKANELFQKYKLTESGWVFNIATNAGKSPRALGCCNYVLKKITVKHAHVMHCDEESVMDTIKHEIAHVLAGSEAGHGVRWKHFARIVGCNPKSSAKVSDGFVQATKTQFKYQCAAVTDAGIERFQMFSNRKTNMSDKMIRGRRDTLGKLQWVPVV